jgi:hypothetical protein
LVETLPATEPAAEPVLAEAPAVETEPVPEQAALKATTAEADESPVPGQGEPGGEIAHETAVEEKAAPDIEHVTED